MTIQFPDTSVNNNVSFFLDFEGPARSQAQVYDPDLLAFRDKTDNTTVSVADNGAGYLQITNGDRLYTGENGYLSTTYDSALSLGTGAYTIEIVLLVHSLRTPAAEGILSVGATASANNWELAIDSLNRPIFTHGTTSEIPTGALTIGQLQHIAIVRTGTGANETTVYLNGTSVKTFTDDTDYNYTSGFYIGSDRSGNGSTDVYFEAVRVSTEAKYAESFTAPTLLSYVAVGDTYSYLDKVYKWDGVKWFDRSKYNANIAGEYQNYAAYTANANTTTIDVSSANFVEVDLVGGQDTEIVFSNEANDQSFLMKVNQDDLIVGFDILDISYDNVSIPVTEGNGKYRGAIKFKPDGTKFYISETPHRDIHQYDLSTPWDLSTKTYGGIQYMGSYGVYGFDFNDTGTLVVYAGGGTASSITYGSLTTPWEISTASYAAGTSLGISGYGVNFSADGYSLFIMNDTVLSEYSMPSPYDIANINTTAVKTFTFSTSFGSHGGIRFNNDFSKVFIATLDSPPILHSYELNTPGDISSIDESSVVTTNLFSDSMTGFDFKRPIGEKIYLFTGIEEISQYTSSLNLESPTLTWPNNVTWSTGSAPTISSTTLIEFNKYNGIWHGNVITENL